MSIYVNLIDKKGEARRINIRLSEKIIDKKKELNQSDAIWKCEGEILKDDRRFEEYDDIEENVLILTNIRHQGGINKKKKNIVIII
jgi:hypothetical protein